MYTELHARSAFSFLEGASLPEELASVCGERGMEAMAVLDRDGDYGAPRFYLAAKKKCIRAHIGAEITADEGWRYPLLVESRAGYQNVCRLITCMKLRAKKGEGQVSREEIAKRASGLICLTGGDEGPLAARTGARRHATARTQQVRAALRNIRATQCVCGIAAPFLPRRRSAQSGALEIARKLKLPLLATNGVCYAHAGTARSARCVHLHSPSSHAGERRAVCWRAMPSGI